MALPKSECNVKVDLCALVLPVDKRFLRRVSPTKALAVRGGIVETRQRWESAYFAARVGVGIWLLLRFLPAQLHWLSSFGDRVSDTLIGSTFFGMQVIYLTGILAGCCLIFGFLTRIAAMLAVVILLATGNAGMAAVGIALIGFSDYNMLGLDRR